MFRFGRRLLSAAALAAAALLAASAAASVPAAATASPYCLVDADASGQYCVNMIAGQTSNVGQACLSVNADSVTLVATLAPSQPQWLMEELHFWIDDALETMPQTQQGNPVPGRFPYKCQPADGLSCTLTVPLSSIFGAASPCEHTLYYAVHAAITRYTEGGATQSETAWGAGTPIVDRGNWATYSTAFLSCLCDQTTTTGGPPRCETAFAKSTAAGVARCFLDISPSISRWGWTNGPLQPGAYTFELWAGAGQCDTSKGTLAGSVSVVYAGAPTNTVTITYTTSAGFTLDETHLYVGTTELPLVRQGSKWVATVAPGLYPYSNEAPAANTDTYAVSLSTSTYPIYVIAHAVVCTSP